MEPRDHVLEHKEDVRPRGGGLRRNRAFTSLAGLLVVPVALQRSTKTRSTRPGRLGCRPRRLRTTEFALSSDIALPPHSDRLLGCTLLDWRGVCSLAACRSEAGEQYRWTGQIRWCGADVGDIRGALGGSSVFWSIFGAPPGRQGALRGM